MSALFRGWVSVRPLEFDRVRQDLIAARSALQAARRGPQRNPDEARAAAADVLACLEAFAAAPLTRGLPVPRGIRDELHLRRLLAGVSG